MEGGWWRRGIKMRKRQRTEREMGRRHPGRGEKGPGMVRLATARGSNQPIMIRGLVFSGVERQDKR
jgi:hypothetical protein